MKEIMLSIQPDHCANICKVVGKANEKPIYKKTVEVRKKAPKCDIPVKCYIYCTASNVHSCLVVGGGETQLFHCCNYKTAFVSGGVVGNGKVIGEFVCDAIEKWNTTWLYGDDVLEKSTCLTDGEIMDYMNNFTDRPFYLWRISDLKIYDKPKELREFNIRKPFQSWGYVKT